MSAHRSVPPSARTPQRPTPPGTVTARSHAAAAAAAAALCRTFKAMLEYIISFERAWNILLVKAKKAVLCGYIEATHLPKFCEFVGCESDSTLQVPAAPPRRPAPPPRLPGHGEPTQAMTDPDDMPALQDSTAYPRHFFGLAEFCAYVARQDAKTSGGSASAASPPASRPGSATADVDPVDGQLLSGAAGRLWATPAGGGGTGHRRGAANHNAHTMKLLDSIDSRWRAG